MPGWVLERKDATYALFASAGAAPERLAAPAEGALAASPLWESGQTLPRGPSERAQRAGG
jgi:hypothetical protein